MLRALATTLSAATAASVAVGDMVLLLTCGADPTRQALAIEPASPPGDLASHIVAVNATDPAGNTLVFDISGPSNVSGTPIHIWGSYVPPVANQEYELLADGSLRSLYNGMCLGANEAGVPPAFGASIQIFPCNASDPAQRFSYDAASLAISSTATPALCMQSANATPTCSAPEFASLPYCNASLPVGARVADLLSRMTPAEKAGALDSGVPALSRLGVPSMHSGEGLHGAVTGCLSNPAPGSTGCSTSFPAPIALGAAFDEALWAEVGLAIGTEARAQSNEGNGAMWLFAPNLNPARDPRWGRTQEVPSEDAGVCAAYGAAFVRGLQGEGGADPSRLLAAATLKHFIAYDMEGAIPRTDVQPRPASAACDTPGGCQRWNFDALVNDRDLLGYYLPPFVAGVEAGARSIMCAYNAVRGVPACGSPLLQAHLREGLGWDGHVVSDCTAIELMGDAKYDGCAPPYPPTQCVPDYFPGHNYTSGAVQTAQVALAAGTDVNCGPFYHMWLAGLLANGSVTVDAVDLAVTRVYRSAVRLGLLDPTPSPYDALGAADVDTPAHRALALRAAQESLVLLANARGALPLPAGARLAFIGPLANATQQLLSNYHGDNTLVNAHSPLQAALARGLTVTYAPGCNVCDVVPPGFPNMPCPPGAASNTSGIAAAAATAAAADFAVLFVGSDQTTEAENFDRAAISLAGVQEQLALAVLAAQPKTVVVFISGGVVSAPAVLAGAAAALQAHYGGEMGGEAIVDALTGAVSPAGKLPLTLYFPNVTARDVRDVDLASAGGITHGWFTGPVLLPFGWGLSYTTFGYAAAFEAGAGATGSANANATATTWRVAAAAPGAADAAAAGPSVTVRARVTNTGAVTSDCVVLVFLARDSSSAGEAAAASAAFPRQALVAFARLRSLAPGEAREADLPLSAARAFAAFRGADGAIAPPAGHYTLRVGDVAAPALLAVELVA